MLKLPDGITTCLFDLDGVLTQTARIHAQAWKEMFDAFLRDWSQEKGVPFEEFDRPTDYDEFVDGKPRLDGVRSFLESREIHLPMGSPSDPPEAETIHALGTRKNERVLVLIREQVAEREGLAGKPAPDTFLHGAKLLGAKAAEAAVFEDAQAGVEAGRAGDFGWVVGVDRTGQAEALKRRGADVVVDDLSELLDSP